MSQQTSSGLTSITGNVTVQNGLPTPSATQTLVFAAGINANSGATIYTVTAGKTFYCMGYSISTGFGGIHTISIAATPKFGCLVPANTTSVISSTSPIFTATATQAITVTSSGGNAMYINFWGYEV